MTRSVRTTALVVLTFACSAGLALGDGSYGWGSTEPDHNWTTADNWTIVTCPPSGPCADPPPSDPADHAFFLYNAGFDWLCVFDFGDEEIGDLTIKDNVDFSVASGNRTLTVDCLILDARSLGATEPQITINFDSGANLVANE